MKAEYTAQELEGILGLHRTVIKKRAAAKNWGFRDEKKQNSGSPRKLYISSTFDPEFLKRLAEADSKSLPTTVNQDTARPAAISPAAPPAVSATGETQRRALARSDLLRHYQETIDTCGWGDRVKAREGFAQAFNSGQSFPLIYDLLGPVSWQTIESWKRRQPTSDLADRRGAWRRGQHILNAAQKEIVLRCALNPNKPRISEAIRLAKAVMSSNSIANGHSERTYRRFLRDWRDRNLHLWTFTREGKSAWNDQCALSIERDYDAIGVGDVIVADGHVLNFEILSPWTGKPKRMTMIMWLDMKSSFPLGWEIMPTENTAAIAAGLRRAILRLGKLPRVAYMDNGKAFGARFFNGQDLTQCGFTGLFSRLGIQTIFAWPYHGQSKTVERFFGTFAELERMCPTYTGTSIEDKPPRLHRGERIHRLRHEHITGGNGITMEQAHRAIAFWFDEYALRPQRGHLEGKSPMEVFTAGRGPGVNRLELAYLMMADEQRTINRNGVNFLGRNYYDPALYGRRHPVTIRYDLQDPSSIYVFEQGGEFICEARPLDKIHPAASILGTDEDKARLSDHIRMKKDQERQASAFAREFLDDQVIPEHNRMLALIGIEDKAEDATRPKQLPPPMTEAEERRIQAEAERITADTRALPDACQDDECEPEVVDDAAELRMKLDRMTEPDRYEALSDMELQGQLLTKEWRAFMVYFEETPGYQRHREYFEERRARLAAAYGVNR